MDPVLRPPLNPCVSEAAPALSVVIPFFNEAGNAGPLLAELRTALASLPLTAEVIVVDDGSTDETGAELAAAARAWPAVRVRSCGANRGQAAALWEGFAVARGAWVAMLDGDGQNPPADLGRLWAVRERADLIAGIRSDRRDPALRRAMSRVANAVRRVLLRDGVSDTGCSLKLFRREVARSFLPIRSMYSFLPAFALAAGYTVHEVGVGHRPRRVGNSKYGFAVMAVRPLLDLLALSWVLRRAFRQRAGSRPGNAD